MAVSIRRAKAWLGARRVGRVAAGPAAGLRIGRHGASADYALGTNELPVQVAVVDALAPGDRFLDVGANVGFFSLLAARAVGPGGAVYAAEPVPDNAAQIRANARRNRLTNIEVLDVAITASAGTATLLLARHPGGAAVASAGLPPDPSGSIDVRTETVDGLVASGRIPAPTAVKIDVEGAEAAVLRGMGATLRAHGPTVICEVDGETPELVATKRAEVTELLEQAGYDIEVLAPSYEASSWHVEHLLARPARPARASGGGR